MTDKVQLIKEEIKKLKQTNGFLPVDNHEICDAYRARGYQLACNDIIQFIDSLQKQPISDDLEKAAKEYVRIAPHNDIGIRPIPFNVNIRDLYNRYDIIDSFIAGAKWQKQQMMKDAVDAFVNTYENTDDSNYVEFVTEQSPYKLKETEKCKLIIVKED